MIDVKNPTALTAALDDLEARGVDVRGPRRWMRDAADWASRSMPRSADMLRGYVLDFIEENS